MRRKTIVLSFWSTTISSPLSLVWLLLCRAAPHAWQLMLPCSLSPTHQFSTQPTLYSSRPQWCIVMVTFSREGVTIWNWDEIPYEVEKLNFQTFYISNAWHCNSFICFTYQCSSGRHTLVRRAYQFTHNDYCFILTTIDDDHFIRSWSLW